MGDQNKDLGRRATEATVKFVAVLSVMIFVAAGSLSYWQGWLFLQFLRLDHRDDSLFPEI
ncbi:hypothetical protein A4U53_040980 (plasmid) [Rhizobium ruizarguesonis]|uniref:Uncharacterized protein n=1 Tax=Rhizobium ruizarguesonis TaxID=2081791 RepID=A0ACD5EXJ8_9HYPH|nr:hypothetical protein [Rhizobium leguminosarum]